VIASSCGIRYLVAQSVICVLAGTQFTLLRPKVVPQDAGLYVNIDSFAIHDYGGVVVRCVPPQDTRHSTRHMDCAFLKQRNAIIVIAIAKSPSPTVANETAAFHGDFRKLTVCDDMHDFIHLAFLKSNPELQPISQMRIPREHHSSWYNLTHFSSLYDINIWEFGC
jgi:hypothetical protein